MSWDIINKKEIPCPCGNGTIKHIFEIDDWNRSQEYVIIDCEKCREKYTIISKTIQKTNPVKNFTQYFCKSIDKEIKLDF